MKYHNPLWERQRWVTTRTDAQDEIDKRIPLAKLQLAQMNKMKRICMWNENDKRTTQRILHNLNRNVEDVY